jgi:hypothetical protein
MPITDFPRRLVGIFFLQLVGCIYVVLTLGAAAKGRQMGYPEIHLPIDSYLPWIKNLSWLVFLLPCAWLFLNVRQWWTNGADFGLLRNVVLSGLAVFAIILWSGLMGAGIGMGAGTIIQSADSH